jgi:hypothetical protein
MRQGLFLAILVGVFFSAAVSLAQQGDPSIPFPEDSYVTDYFGTTLVVSMPGQLNEDPEDWWGNSLPDELFYEQQSYCELVNAHREEAGDPLLDPNGWYIELGDEFEMEDGWEYEVRFFEMRPAEVMIILAELGGVENLFPGGEYSFMPCLTRNFYADTADPTSPFLLRLGFEDYEIDASLSIEMLYDAVDVAFAEAYGQQVYFDLYVYGYMMQDGSTGRQIDVYAELPAG